MGVIVSKDDNQNSRLTERINADLREKAVRASAVAGDPDLVEDSDYARSLKKTGRFSWIWIILIVLALISLGIIFWPGK